MTERREQERLARRRAGGLDAGEARCGSSDIVKALAIGAKAVLLGRPAAYAVAGGGKAGVSHMLATMKDEVDRVQGFMGCRTLDELGRDLLLFDQHRPGANATMI